MNRLAIDIGGTFTDVVLETATGRHSTKVLTTPAAPEEGVLAGLSAILETSGVSPGDIAILLHGTTLATNAIIERKGAVTALVTTRGFRDSLDIGHEGRYDQYDLFIDKVTPLVPRHLRLTVPERTSLEGDILLPLDEAAVGALVPVLEREGVESIAIGFLHSYANPDHERRTAAILRTALPGLPVTLSSEVCPEMREYERLSTACANAWIQPMMAGYLGRLGKALAARGLDAPIYLMTSGGGLTTLETAIRFPIRLVESGPAGGALLAASIATECGLDRVLSFDMGGTTAKICLIDDGRPETARFFEVDRAARFIRGSGLPLRIPVIEMVEIGAGGGSRARVDALGRIVVGPDSAGADPGPACYGLGGTEATVTDADLVLGRIEPTMFAGGGMRPDGDAASRALADSVGRSLDLDLPLAAWGVAEIVDENMANASRVHAIERGRVVDRYTLVAFGGAAPLHACRVATRLGIDRILVPRDAGVGSAIGFLRAPVAYEVVHSRYMRLSAFDAAAANGLLEEMRAEALGVVTPGARDAALAETRSAFMRYVGQGHEIEIEIPVRTLAAGDRDLLQESFDREYRAFYERTIPGADVEILGWTVRIGTTPPAPGRIGETPATAAPEAIGQRWVFDPETAIHGDAALYRREDLAAGATLRGPAVIGEAGTTTWLAPGFTARVLANGALLLERDGQGATP